MEPAVARRESTLLYTGMLPQNILPQWGPPLNGGSTREPLVYARDWD